MNPDTEKLVERFGEPIGKTIADAGVADERTSANTYEDEPIVTNWSNVVEEETKMKTVQLTPALLRRIIKEELEDMHSSEESMDELEELDEDDLDEKLDPKLYAHIQDRPKPLKKGSTLTMKSLGGGSVGGHGKAELTGLEKFKEIDEMEEELDEMNNKTKKEKKADEWKKERPKGCKCPTASRSNPSCPIHGSGTIKEMEEEDLDEVTPPGYEKIVKALKKEKSVDNPYAIAYSMKNKGIKPKK